MALSSSDSDGDAKPAPRISRNVPGGRLVLRATLSSSDGDDEDESGESDGVWDDERVPLPGTAVTSARAARAAAQAALAGKEVAMPRPKARAARKMAVAPARSVRAAAQAVVAARAARGIVGAPAKSGGGSDRLGPRRKRVKIDQVKANLRDNYDFSNLNMEDDYDSFEDYDEDVLVDFDDSDTDAPDDGHPSSDESADEDETETEDIQSKARSNGGGRRQGSDGNGSAKDDGSETLESQLKEEETESDTSAVEGTKTSKLSKPSTKGGKKRAVKSRRSNVESELDSESSDSSTEDENILDSDVEKCKGEDEEEEEERIEEDEGEDEGVSSSRIGFTRRKRVSATMQGRPLFASDVRTAKESINTLMDYTSALERRAIARGEGVRGPPIHEPLSQIDVLARKFRWPTHTRNVRNSNFSQDATEIIDDYEVIATKGTAFDDGSSQDISSELSAFASAPRPIMASTAFSIQNEQRKRNRGNDFGIEQDRKKFKVHPDDEITVDSFVNISRLATAFTDRFVESLLKTNLEEMQGAADHVKYSQRSWTPLPVSRRPTANWRFVFEHMLMNRDAQFGEPSEAFWPRMKPQTIERIRDRLKSAYDQSWCPDDDTYFDQMTREEES